MVGAMAKIPPVAPAQLRRSTRFPTVRAGALLMLSSFSPSEHITRARVSAPPQLPPPPHDTQTTLLRDAPRAFGVAALAKPLWKHAQRVLATQSSLSPFSA